MLGLIDAWWAHHHLWLPYWMTRAAKGAVETARGFRESCGEPFVDFVMAGGLSFGFVFIHPFEDGNGRLHRLILHQALAVTQLTPPGLVVPTSAAILHDQVGYDAALEDFSKRIMPFVDYAIDRDGALTIRNDTADLYRYPDLTAQIEALCGWFESAVKTELVDEIRTLHAIDAAKEAMRDIVELPDQRENLFLRLCMESFEAGRGYRLSKTKRRLFEELTDAEIAALDHAFTAARSTE